MGNILIVDDERSIRVTVKAFLEGDGHCVETAEEVASAIAILRSKPIDVVVTDIILPKLSGVDLLRQVQEIAPHVQVIMMTGEPTMETASESLRYGALDYLQKPVGKSEILRSVQNALRVRRLDEEKTRLENENRRYVNHLEQLVDERTRALAASELSLRQRAEELSILNRLARKVNESIALNDAISNGLSEIVRAALPDLAILFLRDGEALVKKGIFPESSESMWHPQQIHEVGRCLCGLAVRAERAIFSFDINADSRCSLNECKNAGFSSFAALPLKSGSEILGVLGIAAVQKRDFSENGAFLESLAMELSVGLKKCLLYEEVQRHATELKSSLSRIEEADAERITLHQHLQRSQKMEAIGTLASGIAHDFNNILGAVIGYTELALLDTPSDSSARESLQLVLAASDRAKDLVNQILAFSRQSKEERKPIQITHIVNEVLKFIRASLPTTIEIRKHIWVNVGNIEADPVQIHQVLMNLCTNAHHAMRERGGILEIEVASVDIEPAYPSLHPDLAPGPYVKVTVADSGHGMDQTTMEKIFDPYFTTKEKGVGTGLGLAVVHGIMQKHGGTITVESAPEEGARFELYFPTIRKPVVAEATAPEEIPRGHERILFVDDEQELVNIGQQLLKHLGYAVETRTSSVEALALFRAHPERYDLVITDMTMPNMTGEKLAAAMMQIRPGLPIILCTGYSERHTEEQAKAMGIQSVVMKPILMAQLAKAVREALRG